MNEKKDTLYRGILLKISGTSSCFLIAAILILAFISVDSIETSSRETALLMGNYKLHGDSASFRFCLDQEYGQISLRDGDLVDEHGNSIYHDFKIVDKIAAELGIEATIFVYENNDFKRITTSLIDNAGNRAVDTYLGTGHNAYNTMLSGQDYIGEATILGRQFLTVYKPLFAGNARDVIGILFVGIELSSINEFITQTRNSHIIVIVLIAVAILLIATLFNFMTGRFLLLKPIRSVLQILKGISEGQGDLTSRIIVNSRDEIGGLGHYFNLTLEQIKNMVINIRNEADALSGIGVNLSSNMNETAAAMNEITANIQSIKNLIMSQSASVTQTNANMGQITDNINKLSGHVDRQTASVAQSSSAIEQMLANIHSVTQTLIKNVENVEELTAASEIGRTGLSDVAQNIQEIARESEGLLEINSVMENIASQTNLLSMNAAIEAAHAGEAGKGFAVVADEIRKLAENSSEQLKTISTVLKKIKSSIDKITQSTDNVLKRFEAIDTGISTVAEQEMNIRNAMEEQGHGSKQILEAISLVNETTQIVKNMSEEMLVGAREVIREGDTLEKATLEITGGINEMVSGSDQVNSAVNGINELSKRNSESISLLTRDVLRFKVE